MLRNRITLATVLVMSAMAMLVGRTTFSNGEEKPAASAGVFELRTYTTLDGRLPNLNARFKNHTMKLFEKHGMKNVMYWTPIDEKLKDNTLIYVIWHASQDAAKKSWDGFRNDPEWKAARDESEKDGKIVAKVDSVYMTATEYSPGK